MSRRSRMERWTVAVATVVVTVAAVALYLTLPTPTPAERSGKVKCLSGAAVVGIWVEAPKGDAGWAVLGDAAQGGSERTYRHRLRYGAHGYSVHVGCGGDAQEWAIGTESQYVRYSNHDFVCDDRPDSSAFRVCS